MLKIARIAIKKNAAFSDCIVVFGGKPYIVAKNIIGGDYPPIVYFFRISDYS